MLTSDPRGETIVPVKEDGYCSALGYTAQVVGAEVQIYARGIYVHLWKCEIVSTSVRCNHGGAIQLTQESEQLMKGNGDLCHWSLCSSEVSAQNTMSCGPNIP